jgi:hypothetical protein
MSLIPKELDEKRLASFKASLLNLRGAILDQHRRNHIRREGGGGGGGDDGASHPPRRRQQQQQQQQQQRRQHQRRQTSPINYSGNANVGNRNANQSSAAARSKSTTSETTAVPSSPMSVLPSLMRSERESLTWVLACAIMAAFFGFAVGAGWLAFGPGSYQSRRHRVVPGGYNNIKPMPPPARIAYAMSSKRANDTTFVVEHATISSRSSSSYSTPSSSSSSSSSSGGGRGGRGGEMDDDGRVVVVGNAWRIELAGRIRGSLPYRIVTLGSGTKMISMEKRRFLFAHTPLWPPNWPIFRDVDVSRVDVRAGGGLSSPMVSSLSFVLPWRGDLIRKLARRDRAKINLRDGSRTVERSSSFVSSILSSIFSSSKSNRPIDPYSHPMAFHALREYVIRFDNGYVHPDLGLLIPAPSGEWSHREYIIVYADVMKLHFFHACPLLLLLLLFFNTAHDRRV